MVRLCDCLILALPTKANKDSAAGSVIELYAIITNLLNMMVTGRVLA